jgi:hypothetical protein
MINRVLREAELTTEYRGRRGRIASPAIQVQYRQSGVSSRESRSWTALGESTPRPCRRLLQANAAAALEVGERLLHADIVDDAIVGRAGTAAAKEVHLYNRPARRAKSQCSCRERARAAQPGGCAPEGGQFSFVYSVRGTGRDGAVVRRSQNLPEQRGPWFPSSWQSPAKQSTTISE